MKKNGGITLIALVITIVLMLILASITINVAINGGMFGYAQKAIDDTEIASEKEILKNAAILAVAEDKRGKLSKEDFQKNLNKLAGEGKTTIYDTGEGFEVLFQNSGLYYEVDKKGNIGEYKTAAKDKSIANIFFDENGNSLDGTNAPYQINCIEDLVILANLANGVGNYIDEEGNIVVISRYNSFSGNNFELMRTLNFNSPTSYADLNLKWSYDAEANAYIIDEDSTTNLMEIITDKDGVGFVPINNSTSNSFCGNFDGNSFEIQNIYENKTGIGGLFGRLSGNTIKNLGITGIIISGAGAGGLAERGGGCYVLNCYSKVDVTSKLQAGGFFGETNSVNMVNCYNLGNISNTTNGGYGRGGLIGFMVSGNSNIINCYNLGDVIGNQFKASGGLTGLVSSGTVNISNFCSLGLIPVSPAYTVYSGVTAEIENCYYSKKLVENNKKININEGATEITDTNVQTVLQNLNTYVNAHKNDYEVPLVNWIMGPEGYPILDLKY